MLEAIEDELTRWLIKPATPVLWLVGGTGTGKTAMVEAALGKAGAPAVVIRLSAGLPDYALVEAVEQGSASRAVTAKQLIHLATDRGIVFIDALEVRQQGAGQVAGDITDCRFRQLLVAASAGVLSGAVVIVTSRIAPPRYLSQAALTVLTLPNAEGVKPRSPQTGSEAERLLESFIDAGNIAEAVMVYWRELGNFERLHSEGRDHFGAQICRQLNQGLGPSELSPALNAAEGAWAVMNDWSQFAFCCGDARVSAAAAESAYRVLPKDNPRWDAARLAAHVAKACLLTGNLRSTMEWCERSWMHAREGMRQTEGFAVREVMEAYDWAANTIGSIYLRLSKPLELRRLMDDLIGIHEHARKSIEEFNRSSIIPLEAPSGDLKPEQLLNGLLAAMLALAEGRFDDVRPLVETHIRSADSTQLRALLLRAEIASNRSPQAHAILASLRDEAEQWDDCAQECELALLSIHLTVQDAGRRLALVDSYLPRAAACGLDLHWRDFQIARSRALADMSRLDEARKSAEEALLGANEITGSYACEDWAAVRDAVAVLQSAGGNVADHILDALKRDLVPERCSPTQPSKQRPAASGTGEGNARENLHAAALRVVDEYRNEGMPFALFFRKFDINVLHGPFEHGPNLAENALRNALPSQVEVLTIQDERSTYDGSSRLSRGAPGLSLDDENWAAIVESIIPFADLIVSEPLMLGQGVRRELEMIYKANRWDRTVLMLPPLHSYLATIDNDSLVQLFPRCIWTDSMHEKAFTESPVIADLLERIRRIASLSPEQRRPLAELKARDKAYPLELLHVAEYFETQVRTGSVFGGEDEDTRYYAFWQMFRASGIRGVRYQQGDRSLWNRRELANSYLQMSNVMLDHSREGEKFILQGDPAEAKLLVQSAYGIIGDDENDLLVKSIRAQAEELWEELSKAEQVMRENPERFEIRPRYGPLLKRRAGDSV